MVAGRQLMMDLILEARKLVGYNSVVGIRVVGAPTEAYTVYNRTNSTCTFAYLAAHNTC
jgi:hypothetical protein